MAVVIATSVGPEYWISVAACGIDGIGLISTAVRTENSLAGGMKSEYRE